MTCQLCQKPATEVLYDVRPERYTYPRVGTVHLCPDCYRNPGVMGWIDDTVLTDAQLENIVE